MNKTKGKKERGGGGRFVRFDNLCARERLPNWRGSLQG